MTRASCLKRVFNIDIETCAACGGPVEVTAGIEDPVVIKQILAHVKHKAETSEPGPLPESRAPRLGCSRSCLTDEPKANGSNQNAALATPRQGFAVPDGGNGADCGE
jgi:hypothetical protein